MPRRSDTYKHKKYRRNMRRRAIKNRARRERLALGKAGRREG